MGAAAPPDSASVEALIGCHLAAEVEFRFPRQSFVHFDSLDDHPKLQVFAKTEVTTHSRS